MKSNKAFTLVEMLVVVLIIGILVAIAVPQYQKAVAKSQLATLKGLINSIVNAQEVYFLTHNKYASNFAALDISMPSGGKVNTNYDTLHNEISYEKITYDWGTCQLNDYHANCHNSKVKMTLDYYYLNAKQTPALRVCTVSGTTDLTDYRNSICKEESGADSGNPYKPYNAVFWYYK